MPAMRAMGPMGAKGMGAGASMTRAGLAAPPAKAADKRKEAAVDDGLFDAAFEAPLAFDEPEDAEEHEGGSLGGGMAKPSSLPPPPAIGPAVRQHLAAGVTELKKALAQAGAELQAGRAPDATALQTLRVRLLKLITDAGLAMHLPLLERYLRASLFALLALLQGNAAPAAVGLLQQQKAELDAAIGEADALLGPGPAGRPFWEATI
jgi:hypothetical protein